MITVDFNRLAIRPGHRILDIGCGSGAFGRVVREKWGCRVIGVERNPAAAANARLVLDHVFEADIINLVARRRKEEWLEFYGGRISSEWFFSKALHPSPYPGRLIPTCIHRS